MFKFDLKSVYDADFDIIDLRIPEDYQYDYSIEADTLFILDIDKDKRIVGFEIIDASKYFDVPCNVFYQSEWFIKINVTVDVIKLNLTLKTDEIEKIFIKKVLNEDNVMPGEYEYCRQL